MKTVIELWKEKYDGDSHVSLMMDFDIILESDDSIITFSTNVIKTKILECLGFEINAVKRIKNTYVFECSTDSPYICSLRDLEQEAFITENFIESKLLDHEIPLENLTLVLKVTRVNKDEEKDAEIFMAERILKLHNASEQVNLLADLNSNYEEAA
ncbi:protein of unknown function [Acetoanaerobium sticklandii]|uniref:Uncharacterized protein n=1 Tax=Acetoanaerobium sticklandii (strain ATCC 12662 / DSM 519 / JCM 1433 / CCUG 9281 / NCIMB 10654 / HF) TaxID=499177 RepID=E3PVT3_ACESD|nr:hypothetical protein [Acetoanaerobium sticklandii]CBH22636.1 protein of unknown function [Acetoanaerobium sticklandii]